METVVILTAAIGRPNAVVKAARAAGFRVALRDLAGPPGHVALDAPDIVVLDLTDDIEPSKLTPMVLAMLASPAMEKVPVVAVVAADRMGSVVGLGWLADFCRRPLDPAELGLRLRRLLTRHGRDDDRIAVGALTIDLQGYQASLEGAPLDLTYQEFELLKFLASNPDRAFTRDQLLARVWGHDYYGGSRTVDIHVRRVRAKLGPEYSACIKTIRHVGYKWAVPVEFAAASRKG